ncbi:hypothetical protein Pyrde_0416 [Pyrodictium delaneyi]|uniref:Uncharacterized protein n=1 Tax=Pyrodictium delaneyi TaxID=1273541 RepID=A0A0P0N0T6_9CREN|nr:hypothetical protein [Pyrodictium delaneyi]ALL00466.1 hypothetical protein Pyrde_0416 [Pyrodictium delaneyi]OWJ53939.1 hypothetical protein Pdsh_08615 [Pyrodictium delaneyi]
MYRALWLVLDHLVDLEEDRRNNVVTGVRLALDIAREPMTLRSLVERLHQRFNTAIEGLRHIAYAENLEREYERLMELLNRELGRLV